jgi:hypothetical protein
MAAKSKKPQMAAGAALAAQQGKRSKSSLKGASKQMAKPMSQNQLKDFPKTKRGKVRRVVVALRSRFQLATSLPNPFLASLLWWLADFAFFGKATEGFGRSE